MLQATAFFRLIGSLFLIDNIPGLKAIMPLGESLSELAAPIAVVAAVIAVVMWRPSDAHDGE